MIKPFSARLKKGRKHKTFRTLDDKGEIDLTWFVSPVTGNLFFMGHYIPDGTLTSYPDGKLIVKKRMGIAIAGFVNKGSKRMTYSGNLLEMDQPLATTRRRDHVFDSILAGTRWNGFSPKFFKGG